MRGKNCLPEQFYPNSLDGCLARTTQKGFCHTKSKQHILGYLDLEFFRNLPDIGSSQSYSCHKTLASGCVLKKKFIISE